MVSLKTHDYQIQKALSVLIEHGLVKPVTVKKKVSHGTELVTHMDNVRMVDNILQEIEVLHDTGKETVILALDLTNIEVTHA